MKDAERDFVEQLAWPDGEESLLPVTVQDGFSGEVLMQAWVNRAALRTAVRLRRGVYFSRSRQQLWFKGETSGHDQRLLEVRLDCDGDSLLYLVEQQGPACHRHRRSCFFRRLGAENGERLLWADVGGAGDSESGLPEDPPPVVSSTLHRLQQVLAERRERMPADSYVADLYRAGAEALLAKVREEAAEVEEAARQLLAGEVEQGRLVEELADLWFHSLVLLHGLDGSTGDILAELEKRFGQSGLEEKRSRPERGEEDGKR